jgi:hypothetical protein
MFVLGDRMTGKAEKERERGRSRDMRERVKKNSISR